VVESAAGALLELGTSFVRATKEKQYGVFRKTPSQAGMAELADAADSKSDASGLVSLSK
jgi:hypothetical protein